MKKPIIAANWKLNKNPQEATEFLKKFCETVTIEDQAHFVVYTPAINLLAVAEVLKGTKTSFGLQNIYFEGSGAFTGENSAEVAKQLGCNTCLVGHSERRQIFLETDDVINKKFLYLQSLELIPMLCLGETLEQREAGITGDIIRQQLRQGLTGADFNKEFVVAYEPVWAIGTGKVATPEIAEEAHQALRQELTEIMGRGSDEVAILYGGSVKPENAKELYAQKNIDGFLIGGASLKVKSFVEIYKQIE